jgi:hypothetical protein
MHRNQKDMRTACLFCAFRENSNSHPTRIASHAWGTLVAGREATFQKVEPILRILENNLDYMGELIGLASAWEMVFIMHYYGMFLSLFHSVQICQSERPVSSNRQWTPAMAVKKCRPCSKYCRSHLEPSNRELPVFLPSHST